MVVGISGATGVIYGIRLLQTLRRLDIETHLVVSKAGQLTCTDEIGLSADDLRRQADFSYTVTDIGAVISSGSFRSVGMVIAPCSIHTLSEIATGVTSNLLTRAADVVLKDRRRLVLLVGEFPLHTGHLKSMLAVAEIGAVVAPPLPAFYTHPQTINDLVDQTVVECSISSILTPAHFRAGVRMSLCGKPSVHIHDSIATSRRPVPGRLERLENASEGVSLRNSV